MFPIFTTLIVVTLCLPWIGTSQPVVFPLIYKGLPLESIQSGSGSSSYLTPHPHRRRHLDAHIPYQHAGSERPVRRRLISRLLNSSNFIEDAIKIYGTDYDVEGVFMGIIKVGTPGQSFSVILDTGSGVTAIPCKGCDNCGTHQHPPFDASKSSSVIKSGSPFHISYTEGSSLGGEYLEDKICFGNDCKLSDATLFKFGCATKMTNLFKTQLADGIMGLQRVGNTLINALQMDGKFKHDMYSLCLSLGGGYVSFGDLHTEKHIGPQYWVKYQEKGAWYAVQNVLLSVGGIDINSQITINPIVDSGTTYTYLPYTIANKVTNTFETFCGKDSKNCLGEKTSEDPESVYCIQPNKNVTLQELSDSLPSITIRLKGHKGNYNSDSQFSDDVTLCIPPGQYLYQWNNSYCAGFLRDPDFVIGNNVMMNYDVVFDRTNHVIGFVRSACDGTQPPCCNGECSTFNGAACGVEDMQSCNKEHGGELSQSQAGS